MRILGPIAAICATSLLAALPVLAQTAPGDTGAGVQRGLQELNFSGQVGSVTLYRAPRGSGTLVVVNVHGQPSGRIEAASIQRGKSCAPSDIDPNPAWMLSNVSGGRSTTVINASDTKLLSGNYVVIVHGGAPVPVPHNASMSSMMAGGNMMVNGMVISKARWQPVACGHLYGS